MRCWVSACDLSLLWLSWSVPESVAPPRGLSQEKWFLLSGRRIHCWPAIISHLLGSSGMKHLRVVHGNSLTARFLLFDGNYKFLCFFESNMTQNIQILALSKPWVLLITDKAYLVSPHPLPPCSPSSNSPQRRTAISSSWRSQPWLTLRTSWGREMMQKEQENLGPPMPLLHSLAPPFPMLQGSSRE